MVLGGVQTATAAAVAVLHQRPQYPCRRHYTAAKFRAGYDLAALHCAQAVVATRRDGLDRLSLISWI